MRISDHSLRLVVLAAHAVNSTVERHAHLISNQEQNASQRAPRQMADILYCCMLLCYHVAGV
jgi:hypothetical protein